MENKKEVTVFGHVIHGDKKINELMYAADMANKKHFGILEELSYTYQYDENVDFADHVKLFKEAFEHAGQKVAFLSIYKIDREINRTYDPFFLPSIQTISNGYQWGLFSEMLKSLRYNVEVSQHMEVTKVWL